MAIVAAIAIGIVLKSWGWGIATFFIGMFLFIWVADWIFGGSIKGKVKVNDELEELLNKLETIGEIKNTLPLTARGWCNSLGLYVQLRGMADRMRLQGGDKSQSQIDAWREFSHEWQVMKYSAGDWEKLVDPTLEIATWLKTNGGIPAQYMHAFSTAITIFKEKGHLRLPVVNGGKISENKRQLTETEGETQAYQPTNIIQEPLEYDHLFQKRVGEVVSIAEQHNTEIVEFINLTSLDDFRNLQFGFLDELRLNWPREYSQLNPEKVPHAISEKTRIALKPLTQQDT